MITIADPYVADMVSTVEMPGEPGSFEATASPTDAPGKPAATSRTSKTTATPTSTKHIDQRSRR